MKTTRPSSPKLEIQADRQWQSALPFLQTPWESEDLSAASGSAPGDPLLVMDFCSKAPDLATKNPLVRVLPVGVAQGNLLYVLLHVSTCDLAAWHSLGGITHAWH